jgi:hypothetical protein
MKDESRRLVPLSTTHVAKAEPLGPSGSKGLQTGFLGREASGERQNAVAAESRPARRR